MCRSDCAVRRRGFTVLEAVIALAILSAGISIVFRAFGSSVRLLGGLRDRLGAEIVIREKLAELRLAAAADPAALPAVAMGSATGPQADFRWVAHVEDTGPPAAVPDGEGPVYDVRRVRLAVWREGASRRWAATTLVGASRRTAGESP